MVELLVAVAILGIITGMSIPLIRNVRTNNENRKYKQYAKAMISAAKIYTDSYENDLFGNKSSGCAFVPLSQLLDRNLIKDYSSSKVSCNYPETLVRIVKVNGQYEYSYQLYCGSGDSEPKNLDYSFSSREKILPKKSTPAAETEDTGDIDDLGDSDDTEETEETVSDSDYGFGDFDTSVCNPKTTMKIMASPESGIDKAEKYSVKVTLASTTGISTRNPIDIQYAWVEAPEVDESEIEVPGATVNLDGYTDEGSCVSVGYSWNEELAVCEEKETVSDEIEVLMQVI